MIYHAEQQNKKKILLLSISLVSTTIQVGSPHEPVLFMPKIFCYAIVGLPSELLGLTALLEAVLSFLWSFFFENGRMGIG